MVMSWLKFHLPILFATISIANIAIYSTWKHLHLAVPRLPYRKKWPSYGLCVVQLVLIGTLLYFGHEYDTNESQENGLEYSKFSDYGIYHADKFRTVRNEIATLDYPNYFEITKEMPSDLFLLNVRNHALKLMETKNITHETTFSQYTDPGCADARLALMNSIKDHFKLFASFNISLDKSIADWDKVVNEQKKTMESKMTTEKIRFKKHTLRTVRMSEDVVHYWSEAVVLLRTFMLALTKNENELFIMIYTVPLFLCLFQAFWSAVIAILFSHIALDSLWRIYMRWLLYIGSGVAFVLALYQVYLANVMPTCQAIPNEFHRIQIPSYAMDQNMNNPSFFASCAENGETWFDASKEAILVPRSHLAADFGFALKSVAMKIFSDVPDLDKLVVKRAELIFSVVEKMELRVKQCPKLNEEFLAFKDVAAALKDYVSVRNASPNSDDMVTDSLDFNVVRMDRMINRPIDRFNEIVRSANFKCDEYQRQFKAAARISCDEANVESMEYFRIAIFACLTLVSVFYMIYWRRSDNTQYWRDPRVSFANKFMTPFMDDEHHREWKTIDFKNPEGATYEHFVRNKKKNRYTDVPLIDQSRVILEAFKSDYIHASWIPIPGTTRKYIATQAPLKSTYNDFWHMLLQENVKIVVMLTGFIELDLKYCDYYFPGDVGSVKKYGKIEVTCVSVRDTPPEANLVLTVKRVFKLRDLRDPEAAPQFVTHLHFQNWFAEVVPRFLCRVLFFHRYLDWLVVDDTPIVVHCNSGTERTGVFIAVDYAHELVIQNRFVSMKSLAEELGKLRWGVLDSFIPYIFITASLTTRFIYENYLFEDDWFMAYEKYSATKNNRLGKQDKIRRKKGVQLHYWKMFDVPDYYKPRIRRHQVFRSLSDISSENSAEE